MELSHALSIQLVKWREELLDESVEEKSIAKHPGFLLAVLDGIKDSDCVRKTTIGLSKLVWKFPVAARFAEQYFLKHGSPLETVGDRFQSLMLEEPRRKRIKFADVNIQSDTEEEQLLHLLNATLILLRRLPKSAYMGWKSYNFFKVKSIRSRQMKWLAAQCLAQILDLSGMEIDILIRYFGLSGEESVSQNIRFDGELFRISKTERTLSNSVNEYFPASEINQIAPNLNLLSVGGVIVKSNQELDPAKQQPFETLNIVPLPSVLGHVKEILLLAQHGTPVCVSGPIGVGKSALLRFTASICGRNSYPDVITVQMSDQIDSRLLLGSYHSTDLPGQFIWKPGCLTTAILNGYWIIFEDLDSAPIDVITLLDAISDTKRVAVPGYGQIEHFHSDFRMFCTVRSDVTGQNRRNPAANFKSWKGINIKNFTSEELLIVIKVLFPQLHPIVDRIVEIYTSMKNTLTSSKTLVSIRDLIKFCNRIPNGLDFSSTNSAIAIFLEACDVFVAPVRSLEEKLPIAETIGKHLNLLKSKTEYFLTMNKPIIKISGNSGILAAGRYNLPLFQQVTDERRDGMEVYSLTKRACCLLETVAGAIKNGEPILLIGETGVGKTSSIQYLAKVLHQKMIVVNLNRQSDSSDLLGGYKPVELKYIFSPLREEFEALFEVSFSSEANSKFLNHIMTCFANHRWSDLLQLMLHVQKSALTKRTLDLTIVERWKSLGSQIHRLDAQINDGSESPFAFSFIEGTLINAIRNGYWILLDEINLATVEMLQCLSGVLDKSSQIHLWEKGDEQPVQRHPNFHLFAAMNPSTDVGKKDLPVGIRNRFTELYVEELTDEDELRILVADYLKELTLANEQICSIVEFYVKVKQMSKTVLIDGIGKRPHFSLRTLCRALKISSFNLYGSVRRSMFESFCLSFLTQLDYSSHPIVQNMIAKFICGKTEIKALLSQPIPRPSTSNVELVEGYWLPVGNREPKISEKYILTASVRRNLKDIARVVSAGKLPVLIQGETSVGKTSLIQYLADATGNTCYRINNHQHTDLQEYVGSYQSDENGKLVFTEGVLVQAMRRGEWIILDELNLAPSEVLEALNRLLDDNRQLFITETGVTVTAHPRFMLFATQNPPGLYGGRKLLSRAFRNRFVELHFDEIPTTELETILHLRCDIPNSYCKKIIGVLKELQTRRKSSAALQGKHSFATLRDLFRWAERYRQSGQQKTKFYDWDQHLADEGYLVLAGKARKDAEADVIAEALQKYLKRVVTPNNLFTLHENTSSVTKDILNQVLGANIPEFSHIVWTFPMRRLAVLIGSSMKFKEPILLVGETGAGKTSVVQLLSHIYGRKLYCLNCHMHSESSDFLGGLRPVRNPEVREERLFEWVDGPLVEAMESGGMFLADEISLADDSVLERLNSVLEPERTLLVAEKGDETPKLIVADGGFQFIGTMNPGGDYGKKELSPALRNRLTEIWCVSTTKTEDLNQIIEHNLTEWLKGKDLGFAMIELVDWLKNNELGHRCIVSIRDYLSWVAFVNFTTCTSRGPTKLDTVTAMEHGACLALLDGLGMGSTVTESVHTTKTLKESAIKFLRSMLVKHNTGNQQEYIPAELNISGDSNIQLGPFLLKRKFLKQRCTGENQSFSIESPTTRLNALRIFRAMQLHKPILLEGSPGQGKTALVTALAKLAGYSLTRINLSEQTDISDLFGADLPVEGKEGGHFAWRDGPLLHALKSDSWILLDEMNLASQSVLEGLNACLDHRGEIYVPELNRTFKIHENSERSVSTRIFACQNPLREGGARKGLPKSFLNRFTQVFIDSLVDDDMKFIIHNYWPSLDKTIVDVMTTFARSLHEDVCVKRRFGRKGGPWDFNLRDLLRWAELTWANCENTGGDSTEFHPELYVDLIYGLRMRSDEDRRLLLDLFYDSWSTRAREESYKDYSVLIWGQHDIELEDSVLKCGRAAIRRNDPSEQYYSTTDNLIVLQKHFAPIEAIISCLNIGWMPILVGSSGVGKTSLVKLLANICGKRLEIINPSPEMDTIELLGGFEQADIYRKIDETCVDVSDLLLRFVKRIVLVSADWVDEDEESDHRQRIADVIAKSDSRAPRGIDWKLLDLWESIKSLPHLTPDGTLGHAEEIKRIQNRVDFLQKAYLRCKSFFETQYGSDLEHEENGDVRAASYEYEQTTTKEKNVHHAKKKGELEDELQEAKENNRKATASAKLQLERVAGELEQIYTHLKAGIQTGSFQWIDSILIKALVAGNWLLIDGANRCSAAVLDRLNSLMEPNGSLSLSERGSLDGKIVEIRPHQNFRLILTMDPAFGEISRAMRNRGVEIFMSSSTSGLWDRVREDCGPGTAKDVDISGDSCSSEQNDNSVNEITAWTEGNVCPTLQSEFGITVFDLDALLKGEGMCNPRLRTAALNLHREIHQTVASPYGMTGSETRFSKMICTTRQMVLQMENGVSYKEAMWSAFSSAFGEADHLLMDADKKVRIQDIITQFCQGLDDNFVGNFAETPLPIAVRDFRSSQTYRIWKNLEVISNALSETSWSQHESWRTKGCRELVEDFLILSVFSRVLKKDLRGVLLALSSQYPLKSGFATKLTNVLESTSGESFKSLYNQGDVQGKAHLMVKFVDRSLEEQAKFLVSELKLSLRLHSQNEIFGTKLVENLKKGSLGFVARSIKKTDSGKLLEFLHGFWLIVASYDNILNNCLSSTYFWENELEEGHTCVDIVAQYSEIWKNGMVAVLWRKWMMELVQQEFDCKRPSEKLKSNIALAVQWIGEQVVPALHAIRGINNSSQGNELYALIQKCLEPLDPCGNRMRLERSTSFRSFYGIRPFLPTDSLQTVNTTMSLCLKLWVANAPVDPQQIETLLASCSVGSTPESSHRILSQVCKKLLKIDLVPVTFDEARFIESVKEKFEAALGCSDVSMEEISKDEVRRCQKLMMGLEDLLRILDIPSSHAEYSLSLNPLVQALNGNPQYDTLGSLLLWEDKERFRQHFTECPPSVVLKSSCLVPYFTSRIILDDENYMIKSASLGCREILVTNYKTLNRHLSHELLRPRIIWETTSGLIKSTCESFITWMKNWMNVFVQDEVLNINSWMETLRKVMINEEVNDSVRLAELGCVMVEASCFMMETAAYLPIVDPSVENEFLAKYLQDEMEYFSSWLMAQRLHKLYTTGHDITSDRDTKLRYAHIHPYSNKVTELLENVKTKLEEAKSGIAARPDPPQYEAMRMEAMQFVRTMASKSKVDELIARVRNMIASVVTHSENDREAILVTCSSWLESCSNFVHKQLKRYWYWDICLPYLHPALQAITGFSLICDAVRRSRVHANPSQISKVVGLLKFPNDHVPKVSDASGIYEEPWAYKRATRRLLLSALWKFYNGMISYNCITPKLISDTHELCKEVGRLWREQLEEKERLKEIADAFYVYKGREKKLDSSEEEKEMENIENLFPDFTSDFQDLVENNLLEGSSVEGISSTTSTDVDLLDADDVDLFLKIHSFAFSKIRNHYLTQEKVEGQYNFLTPFVNMFEVGCYTFQGSFINFSKDAEGSILIAMNLMMSRIDQTNTSGSDEVELYDVYRDPNVNEVVKLSPVLSGMRKRIEQLLAEWPDHPALLRIIELMNRIESFDVKSPLMKFLTGLEMLLATSQEWETVAHKGVSIANHLMEISNLVISWRKLELRSWKNLLEVNFAREQKEAKQWWFHLFASAMEFGLERIECTEQKNKFLKVIKQFMESSSIGQYATRLFLLQELHRHFTGLIETPLYNDATKSTFLDITSHLWNSIVYYKQFAQAVNTRLKSLSAPVEKMIKDFIKISRWNDANFYALRDSVKKNQSQLSKMVGEYKKVLRTPVSTVFISDLEVELQRSEKKGKIKKTKKTAYVMPDEWREKCLIQQYCEDLSQRCVKRLSKLPKFFVKSRSISQDVIEKDEAYLAQISELDDVTGIIINKVRELQNLPVPDEKGDKRKKALRHVHNLRRKNLAELFRVLQELDLSFRRGIVNLNNLKAESDFCDFDIEPTDLAVGWKNLQLGNQIFPADLELIDSWNGCESYFQKCISRISVMLKSFHTPSKELGPNIIDRCKGYTLDLLQHIIEEKKVVANCSKLLWKIRMLMSSSKNESIQFVPDTLAWSLYKATCDLEVEYNQYGWVASSLEEEYMDVKSALKNKCESVISALTSVKSKLYEIVSDVHDRELHQSGVDKKILLDSSSMFHEVLKNIESFQQKCHPNSVLGNSIFESSTKWNTWLRNFNLEVESTHLESKIFSQSFSDVAEKTISTILLSFQRVDALSTGDKTNESKNTQQELLKRLSCFDLQDLLSNALTMKKMLHNAVDADLIQKTKIFKSLAPLIYQFCFMAQFYLKLLSQHHRANVKLLSVLSAVFATLGQKGFCLPSDYENDAVEEGPEIDEKSGMGLGEGETTSDAKDVSERLESEDQLDDTMKAGETAESAEKDVKEDDKGVEMSEDFSGNQQDKQQNEDDGKNENSDDENEPEDLNQEMGEVDADGEKIDDKLWGGSSDEEEEDEEQGKEKGKGAPEKSETELTSNSEKDRDENTNDDQGDKESQNKEYKDDEDEEPNDDQVDPYHGTTQPEHDPEPMDLPDDIQLDDADSKEDKETAEENPFDLDSTDRELPEGFDEEKEEENTEALEGEPPVEMSDDDDGDDAENDIDVDGPQLDPSTNEVVEEPVNSTLEEGPKNEEEDETKMEQDGVDTEAEKSTDADKLPEPSASPAQENHDGTTSDPTNAKDKESTPMPTQDEENESKADEQASGQVESKDGQGHEGKSLNKDMQDHSSSSNPDKDVSRKPGETDSKRSLADAADNTKDQLKRLKTTDKSQETPGENNDVDLENENQDEQTSGELYQHIQSAEKKDALTIDNATKEQLDKQKGMQIKDNEKGTENPELDDSIEDMEVDEDIDKLAEKEVETNKPDLIRGLPESKKKAKRKTNQPEDDTEAVMEVEGERVLTLGAQRPADSYSHTNLELLAEKTDSFSQINTEEIEVDIHDISTKDGEGAAFVEWNDLEARTLTLSQELCEQLRLVLEPTQAARLKGDYKTGKRLNMRKVIPYIASGFRKDKIWLRRTQPSKREYQILLALDDSSSMVDNQSKQMAFSAVSVVAKALNLLEAGKLAVGSFGEDFKLVHPFDEPFTDMSGAKIIQQFTFAQKRTRIAQLMQYSTALFAQSKSSTSASLHPDVAQLLIIISDGRGINNEGVDVTKRAIMKAREQNIFIVFIIVDNPENQNSILDIRQPVFGPNNAVEIVRYMDNFPFPFYLILRDITSLPSVLSDALRQWFELVTSSDRQS